jgi:hypothetical protein
MRILKIEVSKKKDKKFKVILDNGESYNFGLLGSQTYLDHHDKAKRLAYWQRHYNSPREKELIEWAIPSPSTLSAYLLWNKKKMSDSINDLHRIWDLLGY